MQHPLVIKTPFSTDRMSHRLEALSVPEELTILLVEDDEDARSSLCDILELDGHRVLVAETLDVARPMFSPAIGVLILDRQLPDGLAEDLLPEIKQQLPQAEIIVVTGYADMDSTIAAFRRGASDYLLKPINPELLRHTVLRISEKRRIELELQREQQFADNILATAEAIILVLDLQGRIVQFNSYFESIAGWKLSDVKGQDWFKTCVPSKDHERIREIFVKTASDIRTSGVINAVRTANDRELQIRWSNVVLRNEVGDPIAVLALGVDVTEVMAAQQQLALSERLAAIGQTMAALAHESRNALQRIHAGLELLELDIGDDEEAAKDLGTVKRAAHDLNELLEEIRSFAAPIQLHKEEADLAEIVHRAWKNLASERKGHQAELIEIDKRESSTMPIDPLRMEQVFRNLFENALAACKEPIRIEVHFENTSDGGAVCSFTDNGPGLSAEQSEKIFEPFFTTKSSGTGLGMAIVKRIIDHHKGEISVIEGTSRLDGASFQIRLPSA